MPKVGLAATGLYLSFSRSVPNNKPPTQSSTLDRLIMVVSLIFGLQTQFNDPIYRRCSFSTLEFTADIAKGMS
jgi:hypothetical protein